MRPASQLLSAADPSCSLYRSACREPIQRATGIYRGCRTNSDDSPETIHQDITRALAAKTAQILKEDRRTLVIKTQLYGQEAVIKHYRLSGTAEKIKYTLRTSPARRFWAAARTLQQRNMPTPLLLACLECYQGCIPVKSYVINQYMSDTIMARDWIESQLHRQPEAFRQQFAADLLSNLQQLYRFGIYHKDTKLENLLLFHPDDPATRAFYWIDLECVLCRRVLTRHDIIRNLVQINGSLGAHLSCEDRLAFLDELARTFPWVRSPAVIRKISQWTARRLAKEHTE